MNFQKKLKMVMNAAVIQTPMRLDKWADQNMVLDESTSAIVGKWETFPYQREIMNAMTDPSIEKVTFKKSARVGYTKMITCYIGYIIDQEPSSILVVQPTVEDAQGYSKDEIAQMVSDVNCLRAKVSEFKSRNTESTISRKVYPGGSLYMVGANAPRGFRRITVRVVLLDEIDGYPPTAGQEGDQLKLAEKRAVTFADRKIVYGSTPLNKLTSRISQIYEKSDQRKCYVPCPHCEKYQTLDFVNLKWDGKKKSDLAKSKTAHFLCKHCKKKIEEGFKSKMLEECEWRSKTKTQGHAGFFIWAAYSPVVSWQEIVIEFLESKDQPEKLRTFVNLTLGEEFDERNKDAPDWKILYDRRGDYSKGTLPLKKNVILVAGADVQPDRIEVEVVAYTGGMESYSIDYRIIHGSPFYEEVWVGLDLLLNEKFGSQYIRRLGIDSGYSTQRVYLWAKRWSPERVVVFKGREKLTTMVGRPSYGNLETGRKVKLTKKDLKFYPVSTGDIKQEIYSWLSVGKPGPCYFHFPNNYEQEYFRQLTAEYMALVKKKTGYIKYEWRKDRERNEALDCRVYARAVAYTLGLDKYDQSSWDSGFRPKPVSSQMSQALKSPIQKVGGGGILSGRSGHSRRGAGIVIRD